MTTAPDAGPRRRPRITRRRALAVAAGAAAAGAAAAVFASRRADHRPLADSLAVAGGEGRGIYIQFAQLLAGQLVNDGVAGESSAVTTFGSIDNLGRLRGGTVDLALAQADAVAAEPDGVVAVGRVYLDYLQCVVRRDAAIDDVDDLAGRTVSVGAPGSGTALLARRVLDALGLTARLTTVELPTDETVAGIAAGELDAFVFSSGLPTPIIASLAAEVPIRLLQLNGAIGVLADRYPGVYETSAVGRGVYGLPADVGTIGVPNLLMCRPDLDDGVAAAVVDVLLDRAPELIPEPSMGIQYLTLPSLVDTAPFPLHSGAAGRYRERYG